MSDRLPKSLLILMAIGTGMVVANNYYNQPLLAIMAKDFGIKESQISNVPMLTQIGYAVGLFLIVPLGDKLERKKLILTDFIFIIAALLSAALSPTPLLLMISSFFIGLSSVIPQLFVPMSAQLADEKNRGRAIGTVMTGMFIGILGSRTLSGLIGELLGWRAMYFIAAGLMALLWLILKFRLPQLHPDFKGNYGELLQSILHQFKSKPQLRLAGIRGALDFASFSVFWTTLVFLLEGEPFHMGSDVAGAFGFAGIAGAVIAGVVGRLTDRMNKNYIISIAILIIMLSWIGLYFSSTSIIGLAIAALFLDMGIQSVHITNQTIIFEGNPPERNRINTVYMVMYFVGGAFGTSVGAFAWQTLQWTGVSIAGFGFGALTLFAHLVFKKT